LGRSFHSIGSRILRLYAKHLGLDPNFTVLDRADAADLMDVIRHELGFSLTSDFAQGCLPRDLLL
jgi:DNA helicase-2/ATP-dependent DNA helicase PcrA